MKYLIWSDRIVIVEYYKWEDTQSQRGWLRLPPFRLGLFVCWITTRIGGCRRWSSTVWFRVDF